MFVSTYFHECYQNVQFRARYREGNPGLVRKEVYGLIRQRVHL